MVILFHEFPSLVFSTFQVFSVLLQCNTFFFFFFMEICLSSAEPASLPASQLTLSDPRGARNPAVDKSKLQPPPSPPARCRREVWQGGLWQYWSTDNAPAAFWGFQAILVLSQRSERWKLTLRTTSSCREIQTGRSCCWDALQPHSWSAVPLNWLDFWLSK